MQTPEDSVANSPCMTEAPISEPARESATWHPLPDAFRVVAAHTPRAMLLETAKQDGANDKSLLFLNPIEELTARTVVELDKLLDEIERHLAKGNFVAGYFSYECGEHFVGLPLKKTDEAVGSEPLAALGIFSAPICFDHSTGDITGFLPSTSAIVQPDQAEASISTNGLSIARTGYDDAIQKIHRYLQAGDTYQVNFTDRIIGRSKASPLTIYQTLIRQQPVSFAAFLGNPDGPILSFSPELFFRRANDRIEVRPMKGTWPRGRDLAEDAVAVQKLRNDEKNRSEHIMIVDLLRNDLGRICKYGSVEVSRLFHVERYSSLLQMTSTCSGRLRDGMSQTQVFTSLFPSGSITGAPKRRTMEIIQELERQPRGVYTGAIGYFAPGGEACFNVAIRTLRLQGEDLSMGVGGGITAGSKAAEEFEECNLKAAFLTKRHAPFSLIETMHCLEGISHLDRHMRRLSDSAKYFGIRFDEHRLRFDLTSAATSCGSVESRIRMEISESGEWIITATPLQAVAWRGRLLLADEQTHSGDLFLRHKTSNRSVYERHLATAQQSGYDEVLFLNEGGHLTEGAISNVFVQLDGKWLTPPLAAGVLPGIKRAQMLEEIRDAKETDLTLADLVRADDIVLCNALRGVRGAQSLCNRNGAAIWQKEDIAVTGRF